MRKTLAIKPSSIKGVRKRDIARKYGIDETTLNRVLNNERKRVSFEMLAILCDHFKIDVSPLFEFVDIDEEH